MQLRHGLHLAYCTNIHPAETWAETFDALKHHTLATRARVMNGSGAPYAIGLRLSDAASRELVQPEVLRMFREWLQENGCYVFTINGFPFGQFHGARVKEQVYRPDWSSPARLEYTQRLVTILADLLAVAPTGCEGSVSTLPGSFKGFRLNDEEQCAIRQNLWSCVEHLAEGSERCGRMLHLGLEPEPLGLFENTAETLAFFERMADECPGHLRGQWREHLGVNYDVCHFACEYEEPDFAAFAARGIRISKIHLSAALTAVPTLASRTALQAFADDVYLHQVIARRADKTLRRYLDLPEALQAVPDTTENEWRVHFHLPLQWQPEPSLADDENCGTPFGTTAAACTRTLALLAEHPTLCKHLEIETYTWGVLPPALRSRFVVDQLVGEYEWCFKNLRSVGLF